MTSSLLEKARSGGFIELGCLPTSSRASQLEGVMDAMLSQTTHDLSLNIINTDTITARHMHNCSRQAVEVCNAGHTQAAIGTAAVTVKQSSFSVATWPVIMPNLKDSCYVHRHCMV